MDNNGNVAGSYCDKSIDPVYEWIYEEWDKLAGFAYKGYLKRGRGVVVIKEQEALLVEGMVALSVEFVPERDQETVERVAWSDEVVARGIKEYDPRNEFLCMILGLRRYTFLRIRSLPGRLSPRAVTYKRAYERASGANLPQCESPLNSLDSEQDQSPADGVGEILELGLQESLAACFDNLEAFHQRGLELDELIPPVEESRLDPRLMLFKAVEEQIFKMEEVNGKTVLRPGAMWAKLEQILLSQDFADGLPS